MANTFLSNAAMVHKTYQEAFPPTHSLHNNLPSAFHRYFLYFGKDLASYFYNTGYGNYNFPIQCLPSYYLHKHSMKKIINLCMKKRSHLKPDNCVFLLYPWQILPCPSINLNFFSLFYKQWHIYSCTGFYRSWFWRACSSISRSEERRVGKECL